MDFFTILSFTQEHLLSVIAIMITLIFIYLYIIEKGHGVKLTKRYRNNLIETQSKIFLNATQYLIAGNKNLAIKEFLNAVELNRETIDTYLALGKLFRSNGEIDKAISIHRSLIARDNISESTRLMALKELAMDFDKGGFLDKAIETYKDVLKINRDQPEIIEALCRIYEDTADWDLAYNYRIMLSKVEQEGQGETIAHILVEKAKEHFSREDFKACSEDLEDAFRFAPCVSAKILRIKLFLVSGKLDEARAVLLELLNENPMYTSFIFEALNDHGLKSAETIADYSERFNHLKDFFLQIDNDEISSSPSVVLSQVRLLASRGEKERAHRILANWMNNNLEQKDVLKVEYINLLIDTDMKDEALVETKSFLKSINKSITKHFCSQCGFNSDDIFWRCPQCHKWETIQFRWKV